MAKALRSRRPDEDWRLAWAVHAELLQNRVPRANMLLVGSDGPIQNILQLLQRDCRESVPTWQPGDPLVLPPVEWASMMILRDVGSLSHVDQRRLLDWLDQAVRRIQIVSTAREPLLPRVQAGTLDSALYYRLNTLYVEVPG